MVTVHVKAFFKSVVEVLAAFNELVGRVDMGQKGDASLFLERINLSQQTCLFLLEHLVPLLQVRHVLLFSFPGFFGA